MDREILMHAGLSKGEIEIYLALLRIGSSLVSKIAQETGLHRTNVYDTLEKLKEKGLVSYVIKENRKYFSAVNPERLTEYLKEKEEEINSIIPELKNLLKFQKGESIVEVYKGKEGLKAVLKDIIKENKDYLVLEEGGHIQEILPYFYPQFNKTLNKNNVKVKVLTNEKNRIEKRNLMTIKELPDFISLPSATAIYGNKVAIFVWDEPYHAILIKSRQIADSYRNFFKQLWKRV